MKIRLDITYDGAGFFGWQKQKGKRTVADEIEKAIKKALKTEVVLKGASRTDRGVHAVCQTAHFDIESSHIPVENLAAALNMGLPDDVKILKAQEASEDFHARMSAKGKVYQYKILVSEIHLPLFRNSHFIIRPPFDIDKAREALSYTVGTHDFTSFCYVEKGKNESKIRTIAGAAIACPRAAEDCGRYTNDTQEIIFEITGNGFLQHMIRIAAGTVIKIARNKKYEASDMKKIIEAKDRQKAASTAPACGLYLKEVIYENKI